MIHYKKVVDYFRRKNKHGYSIHCFDNRNWSFEANKQMANFVTLADTNKAYVIADQNVGADYVVLDSSMFLKEATYKFYDIGKVDYASAEVRPFYEGVVRVLGCSESGNNVNCEGNVFPKADFNSLPSTWTNSPTQFANGRDPVFIYRSNNSLIAVNQAVNNSNLAKVWFHSEETTDKYEEVFSNNTIKIFKILKE